MFTELLVSLTLGKFCKELSLSIPREHKDKVSYIIQQSFNRLFQPTSLGAAMGTGPADMLQSV